MLQLTYTVINIVGPVRCASLIHNKTSVMLILQLIDFYLKLGDFKGRIFGGKDKEFLISV